ncbi:hypothetical protein MMPV_002358 [Pyropia vietnamensis]
MGTRTCHPSATATAAAAVGTAVAAAAAAVTPTVVSSRVGRRQRAVTLVAALGATATAAGGCTPLLSASRPAAAGTTTVIAATPVSPWSAPSPALGLLCPCPPWRAAVGGMSSGSVGEGQGGDVTATATGVVRLPSLETPVEVAEWRDAFLGHAVSGVILRSLTSEDLRDELGVRPLRHRRALLSAIDQLNNDEAAGTPQAAQVAGTFSAIPEFGRILTHLSNVRTVHSWSRLAVQQLILALGVVRLGVIEAGDERRVLYRLVVGFCAAWCVVGVGFAVYGGWRFLRVTKVLDSADMAASKLTSLAVGLLEV